MLRRLRERADLNVHEARAHIGVERTTLQRWENGRVSPNIGNVRALADLYGTTSAEKSRLVALAEHSSQKGIWEGAKVPHQLRALYESESSAHMIRTVELDYIPGLLQTPQYMLEAQKAAGHLEADELSAIRDTFAQRQAVLFNAGASTAPTMRFAFGQSALLYLKKHMDVYDIQVARLQEAAQRPNVEIRVLTRLHPAMVGPFTLIDADPDGVVAPFVFLESLDGCRYVETRDIVSQYDRAWQRVWAVAIPLEDYLT